MAKKGELIPPCEPTQIQILSMPKDEDSGAESQSSDSGLGSQGSGHCPRQSRECKGAARVLDRGPYDPTPLASFTSVEVEVGQRCRDWVTKITDPASRVVQELQEQYGKLLPDLPDGPLASQSGAKVKEDEKVLQMVGGKDSKGRPY